MSGSTGLHWRDWGTGAPDALMLHCSLATVRSLTGLVEAIGCDAFGPDMPGHGQSPDYNRALDYGDQSLAEVLAGLPDHPLNVVGHSFGAYVALRLALEHPEKVARLVLIEPPLVAAARGTEEYERYYGRIEPVFAAFAAGDRVGAAQDFNALWGAAAWNEISERRRADMEKRIGVIIDQRAALFDDAAGILATGRLESLTCPVLLMEGAQSQPVMGALMDRLQARIPRADRVVIQGADHMGPITHPGQFGMAIRQFFDAH